MGNKKTSEGRSPAGVEVNASRDVSVGGSVIGRDSISHTTHNRGLGGFAACGLIGLAGLALLGLIVVALLLLLRGYGAPASAISNLPPTTRPAAATTSAASVVLPQPTAPASAAVLDLSGDWTGLLAENYGGTLYNYEVTLTLTQTDVFVVGEDRIVAVGDPLAFVRFVVTGQVQPAGEAVSLQLSETNTIEFNQLFRDAGAPKHFFLNYIVAEGIEYLKGDWRDARRSVNAPGGQLQLTRQP
jgi:hypothetical protein